MYGRYSKSGSVVMNIEGEVMGAPLKQSVTVDLPARDDANPEIERMWASHRVERLLRELRREGDSPRIIDDVVTLCEEYSIVSQYASFIVLENDAEYKRWKIERRNASRIDRDRAAQAQLRTRLEQLRDESMANLVPQKDEASQLAASNRQLQRGASPGPGADAPQTSSQPQSQRRERQSFDLVSNSGSDGGGGGGALDPVTAAIALSMGAAAAAARRRRQAA
jgi:hypothetical protein